MTPEELQLWIGAATKNQSTAQDVPPWAGLMNQVMAQPQTQPVPTPATTNQPQLPVKGYSVTSPTMMSDQMSDKLMGRINQQGLESRKAQQQGLSGLEDYIQQYKNAPVEGGFRSVDLSPIAALVDSWTGSRLAPAAAAIKRPETAEEKKMKLLGLEQVAQKQRENITDKDLDLLKLQLNNQLAKETLQLGRDKLTTGPGAAVNPFEKKKMEEFGKSAVQWNTKDRAQIADNIPVIDKAISIMESGARISGPGTSMIPNRVQAAVMPDAVQAREAMNKAIADTLRPTLGAQFTEGEGRRIMNLTYNEDLPPSENARRAKDLKKVMANKVAAMDALYAHLAANNGSDAGFDYAKYSLEKIGQGTAPSQPAIAPPSVGDVVDGYAYKGGNPNSPSSWVKQ